MKTPTFRLASLILALVPVITAAQSNIKSSFDAIIQSPVAKITETHTLDKNPGTNIKNGQSDVYNFIIPVEKIKLVKNVFSAFDKDTELAYSINRGKAMSTDNKIQLAIGDATGNGVYINEPDCEFIYALFLPSQSEDPEGIYRYAYGINYKEVDGNLIGKLVVTYATTLKYRQQAQQQHQYDMFRTLSNGAYVISGNQQSWFDMLMSYFQSMTSANTQTRIALASKAFKVIRDTSKYPEVTDADKDAIREILKGMISDKKYSESILNKLLTQCLVGIK